MDYILEAILNSLIDTGIAEQIMDYTITEEFNKILEVQQSKILDKKKIFMHTDAFVDVVAGIDGTNEPDYIEEMIDRQKPLIQVLRLLCLMSVAQGGLKAKLFDHFRREIVQVRIHDTYTGIHG